MVGARWTRPQRWREPAGNGIRVDTGFRAGDAVTPYYDALLAKLIVRADDRSEALGRMVAALGAFEIAGVTTNLPFLRALMKHPQVMRGEIDTGFIEREISVLTSAAGPVTPFDVAAACAAILRREDDERTASQDVSPWSRTDGWMLFGRRLRNISFRHGAQRLDAVLWHGRDGMTMELAGTRSVLRFLPRAGGELQVTLGDATESVSAAWSGRDLALTTPRGHLDLHWTDPFAADMGEAAAASRIVAPMPGTVIRILAEPGADLPRGAPLLVLEAMKMEHTLRAPGDGRLKALKCAVGDFVQEGTELADFEPA
jgi:3-methylcrotonyl-CoA carboxylase alpha subunit